MKRIISQCQKELTQFQRDRLTLALAFLLPFITLIIFGFAIRLEAKNIPLLVQDFDIGPLSRAYIERLFANNQFEPILTSCISQARMKFTTTQTKSQADLRQIKGFITRLRGFCLYSRDFNRQVQDISQELINRGLAKAAVIIPPDFTQQIKSGKTSTVQVLVDGTGVNNARIIKNSIQATTRFFLSTGLQSSADKVIARVRLWFNPGRKESLSIIPGLYAVILWIFPSLLTAIAMVREKEKGTLLQVYASSLSATELLLGKALAYLIIGIVQALFVMGFGSLIWQLSFAGEPTPLLISTIVFLVDSIMFGLLIGVRTSNQTAAVQVVALLGFLTALLLSGFIYPLSNIAFPLSLVSNIVPARYYIEITRDAYVRGTGWAGIWFSMLMLIILGVLLFNAARLGLKRMQLSN